MSTIQPEFAMSQYAAIRARIAELANLAGKMIASAKVQVEYAALRKDVPEIAFLKDDRPSPTSAEGVEHG